MTTPRLCDHCGRIVRLNTRTGGLAWHATPTDAGRVCGGTNTSGVDLPPDVVVGEPRDRYLAGTGVMP